MYMCLYMYIGRVVAFLKQRLGRWSLRGHRSKARQVSQGSGVGCRVQGAGCRVQGAGWGYCPR